MGDAKTFRQRSVFQGKVVNLSVEEVELPNGQVTELEVIHHPGAAAIVALNSENEVLLVRQYRHATRGWLLEVPAGKLDPGEGPETCAERELEEEVGARPGRLEPLGWIWTTPCFTDEKIYLYLARDLEMTEQDLQEDEILSVVTISFEQAIDKIHAGEICDAKSVCALLRAEKLLLDERGA